MPDAVDRAYVLETIRTHADQAMTKHPDPESITHAIQLIQQRTTMLQVTATSSDTQARGPEIARRLAQIGAICMRTMIMLGVRANPPKPADPPPPGDNTADDTPPA